MARMGRRQTFGSAVRELLNDLRGKKAPVSFRHGCRCGHPVPPLQLPANYACPKCKQEYVISDTSGKGAPSYDWYCPALRTSFTVTTCPKCRGSVSKYDWRLPALDSFQGHCDWECRNCSAREIRDGPDSVY